MICRCDHIHLRSRDAVAAARFYVEMLGAREIRQEATPSGGRVTIDMGGLTLFIEQEGEELRPAAVPPHRGIEHLGLAVDDIEGAMAELRGKGARIVSGITDVRPGLRILFLDGPDDVRIELLQRSEP